MRGPRLKPGDRRRFEERITSIADAIASAPPRRPDPDDAPHEIVRIHERTIERQVVVARCKFCGTLAPVDARRCDNCGATGFLG